MNFDSSAFVAEPDLIAALSPRAKAVECSQERLLFHQGDEPIGIYILHAGELIVTMDSPHGDEVVSFAARPGSLFGLPGVIGNAPYSLSATASKGAQISFISREDFSVLMLSESRLSMMILRVLANEVRTARLAITNH
jgi:CRP-like cAMP-binding protein